MSTDIKQLCVSLRPSRPHALLPQAGSTPPAVVPCYTRLASSCILDPRLLVYGGAVHFLLEEPVSSAALAWVSKLGYSCSRLPSRRPHLARKGHSLGETVFAGDEKQGDRSSCDIGEAKGLRESTTEAVSPRAVQPRSRRLHSPRVPWLFVAAINFKIL
ncbi:hypothetical protein BV25DRAFT_122695 [Artomyces pyxidatus]|uniref:Uncharacterized protein n=1 Tax=Artomyces pyxidatus TaxID=48021 RepID=A0ACB8TLK3_9AGAM|nr:hypothetical protein BV25DRAFT_122695 [Artomyces pyxidatus]